MALRRDGPGVGRGQHVADQLLFNTRRVIDKSLTSWDDIQSEHADKLKSKLAQDPYTVAHALRPAPTGHKYTYLQLGWAGSGGAY